MYNQLYYSLQKYGYKVHLYPADISTSGLPRLLLKSTFCHDRWRDMIKKTKKTKLHTT